MSTQTLQPFLKAVQQGGFETVVSVLDPDLTVNTDAFASANGKPVEIHGAQRWARSAIAFARSLGVHGTAPALIDGEPGVLLAPGGHLMRALQFTFRASRITHIQIIADPARLAELTLNA